MLGAGAAVSWHEDEGTDPTPLQALLHRGETRPLVRHVSRPPAPQTDEPGGAAQEHVDPLRRHADSAAALVTAAVRDITSRVTLGKGQLELCIGEWEQA